MKTTVSTLQKDSLFGNLDFPTAAQKIERSKERILENVREAAFDQAAVDYKARFKREVERIEKGVCFTSDEIIAVIGMPPKKSGGKPNHNLIGGTLNGLKKIIEFVDFATSTRASRHGAPIRIWRKL